MKFVPVNFGQVDQRMYRSGAPEPVHFPFLESLQLRTCILLVDDPSPSLVSWLRDTNIRVVSPLAYATPVVGASSGTDDLAALHQQPNRSGSRGSMTLPEGVIIDVLHVLLDPAAHPVLITCPMGSHRTGITVGCLRKLQRWNLASILEEYRRYAGSKSRQDNEEFIELFDVDLIAAPPTRASLPIAGGQAS
jgi:tyrosine-protein phosphatase OCA1